MTQTEPGTKPKSRNGRGGAERPPQPETTRAWLATAASHKLKWTLHHYKETRPVVIRGQRYWEHIFKCYSSGAERRWGIEDREILTKSELDDIVRREGN